VQIAKRGAIKARTLVLTKLARRLGKGGSATFTLKLGRTARSAIARALRGGAAVQARITVTVTDAAGNARTLVRSKLKLSR
jgi:hypothetical protein